jgi:hypothetical protein
VARSNRPRWRFNLLQMASGQIARLWTMLNVQTTVHKKEAGEIPDRV